MLQEWKPSHFLSVLDIEMAQVIEICAPNITWRCKDQGTSSHGTEQVLDIPTLVVNKLDLVFDPFRSRANLTKQYFVPQN